jgi:tetratricopeptide (TPR) repeat protein
LDKHLKKQIKEDEFVTWFAKTEAAIESHSDQVKVALIVVLVLAVGAGALTYFRSQRDQGAAEAMRVAEETFRAPLTSDASAAAATGPKFASAEEKYRQALTQFESVDRSYGSHRLGERARYYAALCRIQLGQLDEAEAALKTLASDRGGSALEPDLARLALADVQRRKGQLDQAADTYKQVVEDQKSALPRDHALMNLAQLYEKAQRVDEALAAYQRLTQDYPSSAYASEAQRRVEYLKARG